MMTKVLIGAALIAAAVFAACTDAVTGPVHKQSAYGQVRISFDSDLGRTVFPNKVFDNYEYIFTRSGKEAQTLQPKDGAFLLEIGSWNVTVNAYVGAVNAANLAASGGTDFTVNSGDSIDITVILTAASTSGIGTFSYTVKYPEGAALTISLHALADMQTVALTPVEMDGESGKTGTVELPAGFYLVAARITLDDQYAGISEAVHIYPLLTTTYEYIFDKEQLVLGIPIRNVSIGIDAPVKDGVPAATASEAAHLNSAVTWSPADNPFKGGTVYTATVKLAADDDYVFVEALAAEINGEDVEVTDNDGKTVTLSYTFAATDTRTVSNITIKTQPTTLSYTQDAELNLAGLVITMNFDDSSTEDVAFADFRSRNITTDPIHGDTLTVEEHNGKSVTVKYGTKQATTNTLTVNKRTPVLDDFYISGPGVFNSGTNTYTVQHDGLEKPVSVTVNTDRTTGMGSITVKYDGSETVPSGNGTYAVTFDVAGTTNYNAATGLNAGTLTIYRETPVVGDYEISGIGSVQHTGSPIAVSVTVKDGKSPGGVTVYYEGTGGTSYTKSAAAPTNAGTYPVTFDVAMVNGWNAATLSAGTLTIYRNTPVAGDYDISGTGTVTYNGSARTVTVTPKSGKSTGAVTVKYNGGTTAPTNAGTYTVTFDVAMVNGWNAATGLSAGTLTINNATPVAGDYDISGNGTFTYDGTTRTVSVTVKNSGIRSPGAVTVKYNGGTIAPTNTGTYTITFDVAGTTNWNAATGLSAGTLIINKATPVADDFTISGNGTVAYDGSVKTVSVTPKPGKSTGAVTVKYNSSTTAPHLPGTYAVTFDVVMDTNWNAATNLSAGTLSISFLSIASLNTYLSNQPANDAATAYIVPLNVSNLSGGISNSSSVGYMLKNNNITKYVSLDLSGSTFNANTIPTDAFYGCTNLTSITIPDSVTIISQQAFTDCTSLTSVTIPSGVTRIMSNAFASCYNLTSVTFQGTIESSNFGTWSSPPFPGDLRDKYLDGGPGTYTRPNDNYTWTKN
jgi:hypothetical protein